MGVAGSAYLSGAVLGALFFGWLTDRLGRKLLFFITIAVYLLATALTGVAWNGVTFFLFRFLTGCGIGGEYAAINSTIQELIPARFRGHIDLMINGSFWVGAALGALVAVLLLNGALFSPELGWRLAFLTGAVIGAVVFFMRMWIPESPRWLAIHGREAEGEAVVAGIEQRFIDAGQHLEPVPESAAIRLRSRTHTPIGEAFSALFVRNRIRTFVGLTLMAAQAFFYNAIFFTYALVLTKFYSIASGDVGWYILPFAAGNFLGPVVLGRLFDTLGRRLMISLTYAISGLLLIGCGALFERDLLTAETQTIALDGRVLLRLGRRERRLSHRQRDVPDRDSRVDDRHLLRRRHGAGRRRRAVRVRQAHRKRLAAEHIRGLRLRRDPHARRRDRRRPLRRRSGAQTARAGRDAALRGVRRDSRVSNAASAPSQARPGSACPRKPARPDGWPLGEPPGGSTVTA